MKKDKKNGFIKNIFPFIKEYKSKLVFCMCCALIVGVCVACQPLIIKYIVDSGISNGALSPNEKVRYVGIMCIIYIVISVSRSFLWRQGYRKMVQVMEGTILNIRSKFFAHVQSIGMKFHENNSSGELFNCIMGSPIINIKSFLNSIFMAVPYQVVSLAISLFALFSYDWLLTIILFFTALFMALFAFFARRKVRNASSDYLKSEAGASKYISDTLNGIDSVKIYSIEDNTFRAFQNTVSEMREKGVSATLTNHMAALLIETVQFLGTAVVYFVGAISCIYRGVSVGVLYAFLSSMGTILGILVSWLSLGLSKASAESGLEHITNVLNTKTTTPEKEEMRRRSIEVEKQSAKSKNSFCIEFKNVDFAYNNRNIFENFSCGINYGESVALVGSSGSGKSTFSKLAMRLYDVQSGEVKVHGRDVRDYGIHDLRTSFGVVPQNPFIFYGSIWENIKIARPEASNSDIVKAMEIAHVHEFVNELDRGWNTVVGDGGFDLSGGQKQRIAIARAVLGNPDVLIFDEATSALDNISERAIQNAMETLMKTHTVIIIAHRLSTIRNVDRILVFDHGNIVEEGTYNELSNKENGVFSNLLTANE